MTEMNIQNNVRKSVIHGDFIGGNQNIYVTRPHIDLFSKPIFLHYLGEKVSKLIWNDDVDKDSIINTTKLIVLLFDDVIVALSDITQSPIVYNSEFFHQLLNYRSNEGRLISSTGTKTGQNLEQFLAERQEYYEKPGFYQIAASETVNSFLDNIKSSLRPKYFDTGKILGQRWSERFARMERTNFSIDDIPEKSLQNLIVSNIKIFSTNKLEEMILLPEHLQGFPFVWDSVNYLKLISIPLDPMSIENAELYLAAEWINCYLDNYGASIPNHLIRRRDCTLGIKNCVDLSSVLRFLSQYRLTNLILNLPFEEWIALKYGPATYLRTLVNDLANGTFQLSNPEKTEFHIDKVLASRDSEYSKVKKIILHLYCERR